MIRYLNKQELRWQFTDFAHIESILKQRSLKKSKKMGVAPQIRALSALELGLGIKERGYNIFAVGAQGTGKVSTVRRILQNIAKKEETPRDLVLLYNFEDKDRPLSVSLPTALGPKLKKSYENLLEKVLSSLERAFESDNYLISRQVIEEKSREETEKALQRIEEEAKAKSFVLTNNGITITLTPANKIGEAITEEEFEKLSEKQKQSLEQKASILEAKLEESMRRVKQIEKEREDDLDILDNETARMAISAIFEATKNMWKSQKLIVQHLTSIEEDIVNRIKRFISDEKLQSDETSGAKQTAKRKVIDEEEDNEYDEPLLLRYKVNVLVSHAKTAGAPVIFETHPTLSNLVGRIEQRIRAGETITDFTRIKAGALYKANGGYLVLEALELLHDPSAWEALKRALKNRALELDDPGEPGRMVTVASLRPEPVSLNLKVILIGSPDIYYALSRNDPDFKSLFKVKADFELEVDRTPEALQKYTNFLLEVSREEKLLKLSPQGVGRILEEAVKMAGNKTKISCRIGEIADILREANFWAKKDHAKTINADHVIKALAQKSLRDGFVESQVIEDIATERIIINLDDKIIGQANALTVIEVGSYEFGTPLRVTCQISSGTGEIIDIERETDQGGPFHSKGRLIIRGYLSKIFGKILPFGFHATLCMEQTYSDVDGDSASMAEACALLSSLAQVPIDQRFAMTGAIDQMGNIQTVGGINQKIEGFFNVCKTINTGLLHGVILPQKNIDEIMLKEEVIEAVSNQKFLIIGVETIEDAMEVLTGVSFHGDSNSIKNRCINTLEHFNNLRKIYSEKKTTTLSSILGNKELKPQAF